MRPLLAMVLALPLAGLMQGACTSSLDEFQCAGDEDCVKSAAAGPEFGRCEEDSLCSFADPSCDDGYRYGEAAGRKSGTCVGDEQGLGDAGVLGSDDGGSDASGPASNSDASPLPGTPPIADIAPTDTDVCGLSFTADATGSQAFDGTTITNYAWTLLDQNGGVIDSFAGPGNQLVTRGLHRLSGRYDEPFVNFPPYHRRYGLRGSVDGLLITAMYTRGLDVLAQLNTYSFDLSFAAAMESGFVLGTPKVTVRLLTNTLVQLYEKEFTISDGEFRGNRDQFTVPSQDLPGGQIVGAVLQFEFNGSGVRWLDNVKLEEVTSGQSLMVNESMENESTTPWLLGTLASAVPGLTASELKSEMRQTEAYKLQLKVTDSGNRVSEIAEISVMGNDCGPVP